MPPRRVVLNAKSAAGRGIVTAARNRLGVVRQPGSGWRRFYEAYRAVRPVSRLRTAMPSLRRHREGSQA
jgi:hypothetical protein